MTGMNAWWSQVSATTAHGLQITVVGMLLVFFTLGLIILALVLLTRLPGLRARDSSSEPSPLPEHPALQAAAVQPKDADAELARVAVITAAILRSRQPGMKVKPQRSHGSWRSYGRAHQLGL